MTTSLPVVSPPLQLTKQNDVLMAAANRKRRTSSEFKHLLEKARALAAQYHADFNLPINQQVPKLDLSEITMGKVLGKGAFGVVLAVNGLETATEPSSTSLDSIDTTSTNNNGETQQGRYVLKLLDATDDGSDEACLHAILDNASEAIFLQALSHPNIIKIRAIPECGMFSERSFLLLDRLEVTLKQRMKVWRKELRRSQCFVGKLLLGGRRASLRSEAAWDERMLHVSELAHALQYMHSLRVIHRDLKADNVGFTKDDKIQLFDFGLARVLPLERSESGLYRMTGYCGSPVYMSPEVALRKKYNEKCDVYSFAILAWEILSLETPFEGTSLEFLKASVWRGDKERPKLHGSWSQELRDLISSAWSHSIADRPDMADLSSGLRDQCTITITTDEEDSK
eukprot:Nitzschia sp. Nitz4//scaffold293_size23253//4628//5937//NITZ4_008502-RA/size23253-processed-gene-0.16-mRNA-1//1//CDS//3329546186//7837//frame0